MTDHPICPTCRMILLSCQELSTAVDLIKPEWGMQTCCFCNRSTASDRFLHLDTPQQLQVTRETIDGKAYLAYGRSVGMPLDAVCCRHVSAVMRPASAFERVDVRLSEHVRLSEPAWVASLGCGHNRLVHTKRPGALYPCFECGKGT